ncbi:hypothetical protein CO174_02325 [Candidatus Uhrbacteria bacterium CG_4_9_14_3_um_filter_50_9]|uniref:Uncharacterized protein n=1 Tax=Candidatus Uhrbacteria bacterium CG_4_9_14_3_um_filter_50_9 TaxID=1975035 RepID=A0A2M7XCL8_9BACT|nr:MAG: hypothetical protein CO174_02325 [Candidatus Uhrbacteria bacterium CG_4_9_14_3_um_filter_50_9]
MKAFIRFILPRLVLIFLGGAMIGYAQTLHGHAQATHAFLCAIAGIGLIGYVIAPSLAVIGETLGYWTAGQIIRLIEAKR